MRPSAPCLLRLHPRLRPAPARQRLPALGRDRPSDNRFAILDGQQRLTSLNIGLRGSHTVKLPNKWWDNPDAFPKRQLYLDLRPTGPDPTESGSEEETGETEQYVFRFQTSAQAEAENQAAHRWMLRQRHLRPRRHAADPGVRRDKGIGNDAER